MLRLASLVRIPAALLAILAPPRLSAAQVAPPRISSIEVGRDTVRFFASTQESGGYETPEFGFVRATGQWVALAGRGRDRPRMLPWGRANAVPVAPGFALVGRVTPGWQGPGYWLYDIVARDGLRYPVRADASAAERWAVAQHDWRYLYDFALPAPNLAESVDTWTRTGDAVWLSTSGEGMAGLIRFDLRTRQYSAVLDTVLSHLVPRTMAATRGVVWMAGEQYPTPTHESGVLGYHPDTRRWTRYTTRNAPPPSDTVLALAASGDTLWVATAEGLAMLDVATGRWDVRWFHATAAIDTAEVNAGGYTDEAGRRQFMYDSVAVVVPRFDLVPARPPHEAGQRLALELPRALSPYSDPERTMEPDSFVALVRRVPPEHFDRAATARHPLARALAHPEIARLMAGDSSTSFSSYDGIRALGLLGDRRYLPALRSIAGPDFLDEEGRSELALALFRLGDTTLVPQLRARVGNGSFGFNDTRYVEALAETGDTAAIPLVIDYVRRTQIDRSFAALRLLAPPARWREIVAHAADDERTRYVFLEYAQYYTHADTISDPGVRRSLARLARAVLATPVGTGSDTAGMRHAHWQAAELAIDLRDLSLVPALIPLLTQHPADYASAMRALIMLTGVDSAPTPPRPSAAQRAMARRFWSAWWDEHSGGFLMAWWRSWRGFPAVPRAQGLDALRRWRMRWELGGR